MIDTQFVPFRVRMGAGRECGPCRFVDHIGNNGQGTCTAECKWYRIDEDDEGFRASVKLECVNGQPMKCKDCRAENPWKEKSG